MQVKKSETQIKSGVPTVLKTNRSALGGESADGQHPRERATKSSSPGPVRPPISIDDVVHTPQFHPLEIANEMADALFTVDTFDFPNDMSESFNKIIDDLTQLFLISSFSKEELWALMTTKDERGIKVIPQLGNREESARGIISLLLLIYSPFKSDRCASMSEDECRKQWITAFTSIIDNYNKMDKAPDIYSLPAWLRNLIPTEYQSFLDEPKLLPSVIPYTTELPKDGFQSPLKNADRLP